jgi:DNA (cytosine-5)-methyltransferase 1
VVLQLSPRPRAADLFCGAGGASKGLHLAGFDVEGWDIAPQKNYPYKFHLADALEADLSGFDFVWASPPCQEYSVASRPWRLQGREYKDLIAATRAKLEASGKPWIMENVPGAPMRCDVMLCGSMFGLPLVRHRIFETNWPDLFLTNPCQHPEVPVCVVGHGTPSWARRKNGEKNFTIKERHEAMGIDWMNRNELSQAVPPAYSEFLARPIVRALLQRVAV